MFAILFTLLAVNVHALGTAAEAVAPEKVRAGEELDIVLMYCGNETEAVQFELEYDEELLLLDGASAAQDGWSAEYADSFVVYDTDLEHPLNGRKALVTLTFTVLDDIKSATDVTVLFKNIEDDSCILSEAECVITLLPKTIKGDIDGDGSLTANDRMMLARFVAGWQDSGEIGCEQADLDGNEKVTARDRMILSRRLDSWSGYEAYFE